MKIYIKYKKSLAYMFKRELMMYSSMLLPSTESVYKRLPEFFNKIFL